MTKLLTCLLQLAVCVFSCGAVLEGANGPAKPDHLSCESLVTPIGMDEANPALSWILQDPRTGAAQSAYQLQVATSRTLLTSDKPDVWDTGRAVSNQSVNVRYAGPALASSKRYYWRVKVWDRDGKPYPPSDVSWWETGLMAPSNWHAQWIGYEDDEHRSVREAKAEWIAVQETDGSTQSSREGHFYFRYKFDVPANVREAKLHITGEDTVAAWLNDKQEMQLKPQPAWTNIPWRTYSVYDVSKDIRSGSNTLAADVLRYDSGGNAHTPFSATLYLKLANGKSITFKTGPTGWKGIRQASGNWTAADFDDSAWPTAIAYPGPTGLSGKDAGNPWVPGPVILLRREFALSKPVVSARLYATALGAYKLQINGNTVGDQILAPGWMDFRHHVAYQAYDVTALVRLGANAIGAHVAPSWYSSPLTWVYQANAYGNAPPSLKAQLRVEHSDGSVEWIHTDNSWRADISAIAESTIYDGEIVDARRAQKGWDTAGFRDGAWHAVQVSQVPGVKIEWQSFEPIRVRKELTAKSIANPSPGTYVFDFGQNMAGVARLRAQAPAGTVVRLRFAEIVNSDGTIYVDNLRNAKATDIFTLAGTGVEEVQPDFTFHGFRYIELTGLPTKPTTDTLTALVFHTDASLTAELKTGSKLINQLWSNIVWGQRSNFVGVPSDCPQRDERLGWTGDAQVFWRAAVYNMGLEAFSRKFAGDLRGTQTSDTAMYAHFAPGVYAENDGYAPGWADAGVIIPWTAWVQYGDKRIIGQNWDAMERYLASIEVANPDWLWKNALGIRYGDWLSIEGITAEDLLATAYWAYDSSRMAEMARALGRSEDEKKYGDKLEKIKAAFIQAYVHEDGSVTANESSVGSIPTPGDPGRKLSKETQTGYVLALYMDLLPKELRGKAAGHLLKLLEANHWRLGTGFLGTPYLLAALSETGHSDVAYRLLLTSEFPSWGYLVEHGATTMWERWNGDEKKSDPSMNSYNHYAYGAVADWLYRYAAGVDTKLEQPGFQTIRLHPTFSADLKQLDLSYDSPYGRIRSAWTVEGTSAIWQLTIPANATGELSLSKRDAAGYSLEGQPLIRNDKVRVLGTSNGVEVYQIPSGTHRFEVKLPGS